MVEESEVTETEVEAPEVVAPELPEGSAAPETPEQVETPEATEEPEVKEGDEETEVEPVVYKANTKYKVMDKDYEIPKEFHSLMKDADSEKMVRELHEKATGLPVVKQKLEETRVERDSMRTENTNIKGSIDGLRSIYQTAVKTNNLLKLDDFFAKLQIPEEVIMKYALSKAQLQELPPEQRQLIQARMDSERQAETLAQQNQNIQNTLAEQHRQVMQMQFESTLARADIKSIADSFDTRVGKPGAFREQVRQHGELMWHQGTTLTPDQAAQAVIAQYGLQATPQTTASTDGSTMASGKKVVQRTTQTIPNLQGRGASPLKTGPRSIEDLKKIREKMIASEGA